MNMKYMKFLWVLERAGCRVRFPDADTKLAAETVRQVNQNNNQAYPQFRVVEVASEIFFAGITKQGTSQLFLIHDSNKSKSQKVKHQTRSPSLVP